MKVLFFSPHAFIDVHALPEALVAENLQKNRNEVTYVGCGGTYGRFCVAMSAGRLTFDAPERDRKSVCRICIKRKAAIRREFGLAGPDLEQFIADSDAGLIASLLRELNQASWADFVYEGIPVGRYASYEFLLNYKINSTTLTDEQWPVYLVYLTHSLNTLLAGKRLLQAIAPDVLVTYNSMYSTNHIMCALADQIAIPHYTLHAGSHLVFRVSQLTIFRGLRSQSLINRGHAWKWFAQQPLSAQRIERVSLHVGELLNATSPWVYSTKSKKLGSDDLRGFFGIKPAQRVMLATMASADERFAAALVDAMPPYEEPFFKTQIEWLRFLIAWVANRPEYFLIIRVHPREFPNKREKVLSAQAKELSKYFDDLPPNVRVNWPEEKISLHDLVKITDVGLNATSTAGLELLLFGIPVVIYDRAQLFAYPPELNICTDSPDDYFMKIDRALSEKWSIDRVVAAYRWLSYRVDVLGIDISDAYRAPSFLVRMANELLRFFGTTIALPGLISREARTLVNADQLRCAIENNRNSHLDVENFGLLPDPLDEAAERAMVLKITLAFAQRLGVDALFQEKLTNLSVTGNA